MRFFEDLEVGQRRELGSFTFTAESIRRFAREFDPQPMHLDEEAGRRSLLGGLAASGWHIGSIGARLLVLDGQRRAQAWGPSPGFRDLRWIRPVLAGDTISYATEVQSLRPSGSRAGWGLAQVRYTGVNQRGELVYSVLTTTFIPMRPPLA